MNDNPITFDEGLSPHERGNRALVVAAFEVTGPIPARAGQPQPGKDAAAGSRAYPRTSGATFARVRIPVPREGLSPHERGNQVRTSQVRTSQGPIPARAGQPK